MSLPGERESPVTIANVLAVLERDRDRHMTAQPASEREMDLLEETLGQRFPEEFRTLLARLGGGIFYERHEVFGPRRLMVHDIELVPDLVSFRRRLITAGGGESCQDYVPFHRADGVVHLLDLRESGGPAVVSLDGTRSYPDLVRFLEEVVLPAGTGATS
jgi:SMI1-KNR4 cell-wall